jgi:hypothetical protein
MTMRAAIRENGLGLFFFVIFAMALVGQALVGHAEYNNRQATRGAPTVDLQHYLLSSDFAVDVTENWQSEYLQFLLYLMATVWLLQRGSPESKNLSDAGRESEQKQLIGSFSRVDSPAWARAGGWRTAIYSRSLGVFVGSTFLLSWLVQSIAGWRAFNEVQIAERQSTMSWSSYVASADFWSRTLQNWQSEFLAVGSFAVLAVYLRQRGSAESKPVGAPHDATGIEG